jgi:hypothetical protein
MDVRTLAAELGVRDFVYHPVTIRKGEAFREVSDGLLLVGNRGAILQVKARESDADTDHKLSSWISKKVDEGVRQVRGTRRTMLREAVTVESLRGHTRALPAGLDLPGVVLLDVDRVPTATGVVLDDDRTIAMTVQDWRTLNRMIRSTAGVIDYVDRVVAAGVPAELGNEEARYGALALADQKVSGSGFPVLPPEGLSERDEMFVELVREWIDSDLAVSITEPDHVRLAVEMLDEIPVIGKVDLGRSLFQRAKLSSERRRPVSGSFRLAGSTNRLLFYCDVLDNWEGDGLEERLNSFLLTFAVVRHEEYERSIGPGRTLLLSRLELDGSAIARTISLIDGPLDDGVPTPEMRWSIVSRFGVHTGTGVRDTDSFGRNERCPCGSTKKFKNCHGGR